jgi:Sec-independent protein translocase protein TatA
VGLGTEILFMLMLGLVVLGPKRLHAMLGHVARAKAQLENALRPAILSDQRRKQMSATSAFPTTD